MIKTRSDNEADKPATQSASYLLPSSWSSKIFLLHCMEYGIFFYFNELKIL